jgi:hypothetical protein
MLLPVINFQGISPHKILGEVALEFLSGSMTFDLVQDSHEIHANDNDYQEQAHPEHNPLA